MCIRDRHDTFRFEFSGMKIGHIVFTMYIPHKMSMASTDHITTAMIHIAHKQVKDGDSTASLEPIGMLGGTTVEVSHSQFPVRCKHICDSDDLILRNTAYLSIFIQCFFLSPLIKTLEGCYAGNTIDNRFPHKVSSCCFFC